MKRWCTWRCALLGAIVVALPIAGWWWFWCSPTTTLLIVRHADRPATGEDALTPAGVARAAALAHAAELSGVSAIYRSDTIRSRDTAGPLASALGLTPVVYAPTDVGGVVSQIFNDHRGGTVLVVGHSNTVPQIIATAGGPAVPDIADPEFDRLFVLTVCRCRRGAARLVSLQYGAPSP